MIMSEESSLTKIFGFFFFFLTVFIFLIIEEEPPLTLCWLTSYLLNELADGADGMLRLYF